MSGGHWNFCGSRIGFDLINIGTDTEVIQRFPRLSKVIINLSDWIYNLEHQLDWDLSSDESIKNDSEFELNKLTELKEILSINTEMDDISDTIEQLKTRLTNIQIEMKQTAGN